ncbi:MAG TPA: hypothetical protein VNI77_05820 [Nitrososphaera sp.]|nr:hypothetical protein [Nitrososphaera sp.]
MKYYLYVIQYVAKRPYVIAAAVAIAALVTVSLALSLYVTPQTSSSNSNDSSATPLGVFDNVESRIVDAAGDAGYQVDGDGEQVKRNYHDILGANVVKRGEAFFFTINLAGNPNESQEYETIYRWQIITTSPVTNRLQQYTIMFPHFATGNSTIDGWYFGVYDATVNTFILRPVRIEDMPDNRVEFPVEDLYIGFPSRFSYWVEVLTRTDPSFGSPRYLVDYAP